MSRKVSVLIISVIIVYLSLTSCTYFPFLFNEESETLVMYDGPRKPKDSVAVFYAANRWTLITGVDSLVKKRPFYIKENPIEVLPGVHILHVAYYVSYLVGEKAVVRKVSLNPITFELETKAGHIYYVKTESRFRQWYVWVLDATDNIIVVEKQKGSLR